jgi:hypothetical protein
MRTTASVSKPQPKTKATAEQSKDTKSVPASKDDVVNDRTLVSDEIPAADVSGLDLSGIDLSGIDTFELEKVPTKISSVMEIGISFIRNVAPDIVDNLVVGETPIIPIAIEMIEWAESNILAGKLTGQEKKRIVINLLLWLVDHQEDVFGKSLDYEKEQLRAIVQHVLPSAIDAIIAATKGQILVNKFAKSTKSCISICCPSV